MFSPAIRLINPQNNENAESTAIARKPGQSQSLLRKAFQDCPNTPSVNVINNKRALASVTKATPKMFTLKSIKTETPKVLITDDLSTQVFPDWAYDLISNKLIDVEESTPEHGTIDFNNFFKKELTPPPTPIEFEIPKLPAIVFEIPKDPEIDYFEFLDTPEVEIPQPNFNDFAF